MIYLINRRIIRQILLVLSIVGVIMKVVEVNHPLIKHNASWRLDNLEDAIEVIVGLFSDYVGSILH